MDWNKIFLDIAIKLSTGSKCAKIHVGCIFVKHHRIVSSGVNGTPTGFENCCDVFTTGINTSDEINTHHIWSKLHETHAEMNAMLSAAKEGIKLEDSVIYVNYFPCSECLKNLIQLGIKCIYFKDHYSFADIEWSLNYANKNNVSFYKLTKSAIGNNQTFFMKLNKTNYNER